MTHCIGHFKVLTTFFTFTLTLFPLYCVKCNIQLMPCSSLIMFFLQACHTIIYVNLFNIFPLEILLSYYEILELIL